VKRPLLLLLAPVALLALDRFIDLAPSGDAEMTIEASDPVALRSQVAATVTSKGGVTESEDSRFDEQSSELTFRVPTAGLTEAMDALGRIGGTVRSQQVRFPEAATAAAETPAELNRINDCLIDLGSSVSSGSIRSSDLERCRSKVLAVGNRLAAVDGDVDETTLVVHLVAPGGTNPVVVVSVGAILLALAIGVVSLIRMLLRRSDSEPEPPVNPQHQPFRATQGATHHN